MWDFFVEGVGLALRWDTFAMMSVGLLLGMFVGALPGFTTLMAMAILLPLSFFLDPTLHRASIPDQVLHSLTGLGMDAR